MKKKTIIAIIVAIIVLAGVGVGLYYLITFLMNKFKPKQYEIARLSPVVIINNITPVSKITSNNQLFARADVKIGNCDQCEAYAYGFVYDTNGNRLSDLGSSMQYVKNGSNTFDLYTNGPLPPTVLVDANIQIIGSSSILPNATHEQTITFTNA